MVLLLCILFTVILIYNSSAALNGAITGLSLWYNNVIPLLLPFMLISNIMVSYVSKNKKSAISTTLFLGILCGYPLGAKTTADFIKKGAYSKDKGKILLPICNNTSPVFLSGYIINFILHNKVSFLQSLILIYTPYILSTIIQILFLHSSTSTPGFSNDINSSCSTKTEHEDIELTIIHQITYVGFYIIICSIVSEFILLCDFLPQNHKIFLASITEITRGTNLIDSYVINPKTKTALALSLTSFGGLSSILQTNKVIKGTGLSINRYIIVKVLCSIGTYYMTILFI